MKDKAARGRVEPERRERVEPVRVGFVMFKYALLFFLISLGAGAVGLTNLSAVARRVSIVLFALFFLGFLALLGFAFLLGEAFEAGTHSMLFPRLLGVLA